MKKFSVLLFISLLCVCNCRGDPVYSNTDTDIDSIARRASVQTVFHVGVLHAYFRDPIQKEPEFTQEKAIELLEAQEKAIEEKIADAIEEFRREQAEDRWESGLTTFDEWGYNPDGKTWIPLGLFAPKGVKFPERVLIVRKVKATEEEISPWEKEYEEDVLAISETANVSPSKAKEILSNIKSKGYTISKETVEESDEITLLYFTPDWSDSYPSTLDWTVEVLGEETNLIIGYDPRGILEIKPVSDDVKLHIRAGYCALKDKFQDEPTEITNLKAELEAVKKNLVTANEEINRLKKEKEEPELKRDIRKATLWDVRAGTVLLEQFYFMSAASGMFLGNLDVRDDLYTWDQIRSWGYFVSNMVPKQVAVILTNMHVIEQGIQFRIMANNEHMFIIFPGAPSVRFTKHSDYYGTPASILAIDQVPIGSWDCDAGIMITNAIPAYEQYKVKLGDSSKVKPGDKIISVGNPAGMQKFTTAGRVSNTEYSLINNLGVRVFGENKPFYNWIMNSNFWIDAPGVGGVSGSGIWATEGSEKGKVVAIRNMGMVQPYSRFTSVGKMDVNTIDINHLPDSLAGITKDHAKYLFPSPRPDGGYTETFDEFLKNHAEFKDMFEEHHGHFPLPGLEAGVPINYVKRFLQERGLDPDHFGWEGLSNKYWTK